MTIKRTYVMGMAYSLMGIVTPVIIVVIKASNCLPSSRITIYAGYIVKNPYVLNGNAIVKPVVIIIEVANSLSRARVTIPTMYIVKTAYRLNSIIFLSIVIVIEISNFVP